MLAEKFILLLETLISNRYPDNSPRCSTTCRHVPIELAGSDIDANSLNVVVPFDRRALDTSIIRLQMTRADVVRNASFARSAPTFSARPACSAPRESSASRSGRSPDAEDPTNTVQLILGKIRQFAADPMSQANNVKKP